MDQVRSSCRRFDRRHLGELLYWVTGSDKELAQHLLTQENQGVSTLATTLSKTVLSYFFGKKETSLLYPKHFIADKRRGSESTGKCVL